MARLMLNDKLWSKLQPILKHFKIYNKPGLRLTIEGILYRIRVGCPWRDLPSEFGRWNSIYKTFNRWASNNIFLNLFKNLVIEPDLEWEFMDGSIVKAHQHSSGAISSGDQAIGKSRGGNTTKIHMVVDSFGLPISFQLTGGQVNDSTIAPELIAKLPQSEYVIADKGYDSENIRELIRSRSSIPVIPRRCNSKILP